MLRLTILLLIVELLLMESIVSVMQLLYLQRRLSEIVKKKK